MRVVIIGGVAGGAACGARLRRLSENTEIIILEKTENVSFANCGLPYYLGGVIKHRQNLIVSNSEHFKKVFNIDVHIKNEAISIDTASKIVTVKNLNTDEIYSLFYDKLVLSPGALPIIPSIENIENVQRIYTLRNMEDVDKIYSAINAKNSQKAVIIGGGYIGLEMAHMLSFKGIDTTIIEASDQVMATVDKEMTAPIMEELKSLNINVKLNSFAKKIKFDNNTITIFTNDGKELLCDFVVLCVGVKPDIALAKNAGLRIGKLGGIMTDSHMKTSDSNIYAIGDAVEVKNLINEEMSLIPLAGPAAKQGRIVADNLMGAQKTYKGTQGTAICKIGSLTMAATGLTEKNLQKSGVSLSEYFVVYSNPFDHATYYPNAEKMAIKVIFERKTSQILGAQIVGKNGVDKKIDLLATALRQSMTINDLTELEFAYAPPYGSAKDVVNMIGFIAENFYTGMEVPGYMKDLKNSNYFLLDVRTESEFNSGHIQNATNISLQDLRNRLPELLKISNGKEILVYCAVGQRAHMACQILSNNNIKCRNLSGGYTTYLMFEAVKDQ